VGLELGEFDVVLFSFMLQLIVIVIELSVLGFELQGLTLN
jgi:hypothetical protein